MALRVGALCRGEEGRLLLERSGQVAVSNMALCPPSCVAIDEEEASVLGWRA